MKKTSVRRALSLICMALFVLFSSACPNAAKKEEPKPAQEPIPEPCGEVPINIRMKSIETAMVVGENNTRGDYVSVKDFNEKKSGPYAAGEEGKTAYIYFRVEAGEKPKGKDFILTLENINAYNEKTPLKRGTGTDSEYFVGRSVLSKGINRFVITVKSGDETESGEYRIAVDYKGGPNEAYITANNKSIPGIYCPAQRKAGKYQKTDNGTQKDDEESENRLKRIVTIPEDDGNQDFVWAIYGTGW